MMAFSVLSYGPRPYYPSSPSCVDCGRRIRWEATRCKTCDLARVSAWDYDGSGQGVVSEHGKYHTLTDIKIGAVHSLERMHVSGPLRERRLASGVTVASLARQIGCKVGLLQAVEYGYRSVTPEIIAAYEALQPAAPDSLPPVKHRPERMKNGAVAAWVDEGIRLRKIREGLDLSLFEMAAKVRGVYHAYLGAIECGRREASAAVVAAYESALAEAAAAGGPAS